MIKNYNLFNNPLVKFFLLIYHDKSERNLRIFIVSIPL